MNLGPQSIPSIPLKAPADFLAQLIMFQNGVIQGELPKYLFPMIYDYTNKECKPLIYKDITNLSQAPEKIKMALRSIKSEDSHNDLKEAKPRDLPFLVGRV